MREFQIDLVSASSRNGAGNFQKSLMHVRKFPWRFCSVGRVFRETRIHALTLLHTEVYSRLILVCIIRISYARM